MGPSLPIKLLIQLQDAEGIDKIHKGIAHVAFVLEVNGQIEEIVLSLQLHVYFSQEHLLGVLVRDVSYHHRSLSVFPVHNVLQIQRKVGLVFSLVRMSTHPLMRNMLLLVAVVSKVIVVITVVRWIPLVVLLIRYCIVQRPWQGVG